MTGTKPVGGASWQREERETEVDRTASGTYNLSPKTMKTKWLTMVLAAALLAVGGGCAVLVVGGAAAAVGVGTYAYINGELEGTEAASLDQAYTASLAAMKDLEFPITNKSKDALQAEVLARNSADKKILIKLKKVSDGATEIRIRVGTFGDESLSRLILDKIKSHF